MRDGLREIGHGRWEGMKREDVERQFDAEYAAWEADPFTFAPAGGESGVAVLARALPVIRDIVTAHAGGRVLVVSHKATLRLVLSSLLGLRSARLSRSSRPVSGVSERHRLPRSGAGAADAVQRHVALCRPAPRRGSGLVEVVGQAVTRPGLQHLELTRQ